MKDLSTNARAGGSLAVSLLAGLLLGLPSPTGESSPPKVPVTSPPIVRAADASAVPVPAEARPAATDRPAAAGMVIGIDPETGKLGMPTREQLQELSDLERLRINHSSAGLIEVHHPDGSVSVDLQGRFQEFATVRTGPDGELIFQCVDGTEGAERALKGPLPGPTVVAPVDDAPAPARAGSEER